MERLINREPVKIRFTVPEFPSGLGSVLIKDICVIAEKVASQSQRGIYSLENYAVSIGEGENLYLKADAISAEYVSAILDRDKMTEITRVSRAGIGLDGYYFCAFATFFAFLWGIGCFACLKRPDRSVNRLLASKGLGCARQVLCEFAAHYIPSLLFFSLAAVAAAAFLPASIPGLLAALTSFLVCFCCMHLLFYELFSDTLGAVLSQFVFALFGSFIAGCFYPSWFFPETVEKIASFSPAGAGMKLLQSGFTGTFDAKFYLLTLAWGAIFFVCAVFARRARLRGDSP
ncbi:MAG: ABC transporter permease [Clostridia bacterium]|nr:ABC transporter permease [Clostridia bacterium]